MIPAWKVKRELRRFSFQVTGLPRKIAALPKRLAERRQVARYDRDFDRLVQITQGDLAPAQKYAIFLLYQPKSVPASVFVTLNYLISHGYAPLVVINGPVPDSSLPDLRRHAWLVVQRPNIGYDFGGYRDGLRILQDRVTNLDRLIVMNDSIWFPMGGDPIREVEELLDSQDLDAAGLNQNQKVRYDANGSARFEERHIESYFYLFSPRFWASDSFRHFWQTYQMSSDKKYTIKQGEIGFSKHMMGLGHRFVGLLRRSEFMNDIETRSAEFLHDALRYGAYADDDYANERAALIANHAPNEAWRQAALDHIQTTTLRRPFNTSFFVASHRMFGMTYLKKNSQTYFHDMRSQYLTAVAKGVIAAPDPVILEEIEVLVAEHDPKTAEQTL